MSTRPGLRWLAAAVALLVLNGLLNVGPPAVRPVLACHGASCPTPSDPPVFTGYPTNTGEAFEYKGGASVFRPGGAQFEGGPGRLSQGAPSTGPCIEYWTVPVKWHKEAATGEVWASYDLPPDLQPYQGQPFPQYGVGGTNILSPDEAARATLQGATISLQRPCKGTPNADGLWRMPCLPNNPLLPLGPCLNWITRTVVGAPNAVNWGPYAVDVANSLNGQAGQIVSSPSTRGVVNTATCFWVEGMGVPTSIDRLLYLAGPPDAYGRQIFYTFIIHAAFNGISWDYDDPAGNAPATPAGACGDTSAHPHLTAHEYSTVSEGRHPDNHYSVTAHESYVISVDEYWYDQNGFNHVQPLPPIPEQVISTDPYPQYVVQVEGVPQS